LRCQGGSESFIEFLLFSFVEHAACFADCIRSCACNDPDSGRLIGQPAILPRLASSE